MLTLFDADPDICRCWTSRPLPHQDHCCFRDGTLDDYRPGVTPCGHWHPDVPKPEVVA